MQITYLLVVLALVVQYTCAKLFPEYVKKCKVSDPKFDDCVLTSANKYVSTIFKGDEKYRIPPPKLSNATRTYDITEKFHFTFNNLSTNYYKNLVITRIHFDFEKKLLTFAVQSPQVDWASDYEGRGEILGKPAHESGKVNITFGSVEMNATVTLDFKMKNDTKYLLADSCILFVAIKNFQFNPYDQVTVDEPMTAEQKVVYQSYIDKIPEAMKRHNEKDHGKIVEVLNTEFMKKCKVSDPKFDDCVLNNTNSFMSTIFKGNEKYGIPARPLALLNATRTYNLSENFNMKFINLSSNFYQNLIITKMHFDFVKKELIFAAKCDDVEYVSDYEVNGEILGKPVHESGNVNMTFGSMDFNAIIKLGFKMKNDKKYLDVVSCKLVANLKNFKFKPNEQVTTGEPMTDEQQKVYQSYIDKIPELFKRDSEKVDKDLVEIVNNLFHLLPFEDIFIT
ncbi:uncharacterized protein CBL_08269 [Carabus blaptoides fortunei]